MRDDPSHAIPQTSSSESSGGHERRLRLLTAICCIAALVAAGSLVLSFTGIATASENDILRVRGLVVVDEKGQERVWIGAPVPAPPVLGKRLNRGPMHGILLIDEEGNERSGYVTTDGYPNVLFTLDSLASQHVLFVSEPDGSTTLRLFAPNGNRIELGVGDRRADLQVVRNGETVLEPSAAGSDDEGHEDGER